MMKPTTYALIAALTLGTPAVSATAQQDARSTLHTTRTAAPLHLATPITLAPLRVVATAPQAPINSTPVKLEPVHIVAYRVPPQRLMQIRGIELAFAQQRDTQQPITRVEARVSITLK